MIACILAQCARSSLGWARLLYFPQSSVAVHRVIGQMRQEGLGLMCKVSASADSPRLPRCISRARLDACRLGHDRVRCRIHLHTGRFDMF